MLPLEPWKTEKPKNLSNLKKTVWYLELTPDEVLTCVSHMVISICCFSLPFDSLNNKKQRNSSFTLFWPSKRCNSRSFGVSTLKFWALSIRNANVPPCGVSCVSETENWKIAFTGSFLRSVHFAVDLPDCSFFILTSVRHSSVQASFEILMLHALCVLMFAILTHLSRVWHFTFEVFMFSISFFF